MRYSMGHERMECTTGPSMNAPMGSGIGWAMGLHKYLDSSHRILHGYITFHGIHHNRISNGVL